MADKSEGESAPNATPAPATALERQAEVKRLEEQRQQQQRELEEQEELQRKQQEEEE